MDKQSLVQDWIESAGKDRITALHLKETLHPIPLEIVCYHCQQCAEKLLKAYLISNEVTPAKVHNLIFLCEQCAEYNSAFLKLYEQQHF